MDLQGIVSVLNAIFEFISENAFNEAFVAAVSMALIVLAIDLHRRGYRFSWPQRKVESVLANISFYAVNLVFSPFVLLTSGWVQSSYDLLGLPHVDQAFWQDVPAWLLVPLAILAYDFADYWNHRLMHMRIFWPVHAIHHSDPDVTGLTTYRVHALEPLIMYASYTLLLTWLGFPSGVLGAGALVLTLHNVYVHCNFDWDHGPLRYVIASPRFHRWHHADDRRAYGKNLANVFPFFDVLFGTYRVPGSCTAPMGAKGVPQNDVAKLIIFPFAEWLRMLKSYLAGKSRQGNSAGSNGQGVRKA